MKKTLVLFLSFFMVIGFVCGCDVPKTETEKINIVTTVFPQYDWIKQIVGSENEKINLTLMVDNGIDMHSFQPSAEDILTLSSCDMFVYIGGESEKWVSEALKNVVNDNMKRLNLMDLLEDKICEEHNHNENITDEDCELYDEHIWLSVKNAVICCEGITEMLCEADPENKEEYKSNFLKYKDELATADNEFSSSLKKNNKPLIFADRFPFAYFVRDYGLDYYAAFEGCSTETNADFETVKYLAEQMDKENSDYILVTDNVGTELAKTVLENTKNKNRKILSLNSMQTVTLKQANDGISYLEIMKENFEVVKKALGKEK